VRARVHDERVRFAYGISRLLPLREVPLAQSVGAQERHVGVAALYTTLKVLELADADAVADHHNPGLAPISWNFRHHGARERVAFL
jgi:hypothetical protein